MGNEINAEAFFDGIVKEITNDKNIKNKELIIKSLENKTLDKYFEDCSDTKAIIPILQKVNEYFLKNCEIHFKNITIIPIETEIYFANKHRHGACHENDLQRKNFGRFYFHRRGKAKDLPIDIIRGGVDICISNDETYYLSILIRSAYFNADTDPVIGIRKVVDRILLEYCNDNKENYKKIDTIIEKRNNREKIKQFEDLIDLLIKELEEKKEILKKKGKSSNKIIEKHCRIKGNDYFSSYNELKKAELNCFFKEEQKKLAEKNSIYNDKKFFRKK